MKNSVNESMNESKKDNKYETNITDENNMRDEILIPADCLDDFKKVMKVGYYKMMKSKGLITESQFEILLQMQTEKVSA